MLCFQVHAKTTILLAVEVALRPSVHGRTPRYDTIRTAVYEFIHANFDSLLPESLVADWQDIGLLAQHVEAVRVAESRNLDQSP